MASTLALALSIHQKFILSLIRLLDPLLPNTIWSLTALSQQCSLMDNLMMLPGPIFSIMVRNSMLLCNQILLERFTSLPTVFHLTHPHHPLCLQQREHQIRPHPHHHLRHPLTFRTSVSKSFRLSSTTLSASINSPLLNRGSIPSSRTSQLPLVLNRGSYTPNSNCISKTFTALYSWSTIREIDSSC